MNNTQKELEKILSALNKQISKWEFNIEANEKVVEIIINIYKAAKSWNIALVKLLIEQIKIIFGISDIPEAWEKEKETRDWNFSEDDEDIACGDVESITGIFLNNLKSYNASK